MIASSSSPLRASASQRSRVAWSSASSSLKSSLLRSVHARPDSTVSSTGSSSMTASRPSAARDELGPDVLRWARCPPPSTNSPVLAGLERTSCAARPRPRCRSACRRSSPPCPRRGTSMPRSVPRGLQGGEHLRVGRLRARERDGEERRVVVVLGDLGVRRARLRPLGDVGELVERVLRVAHRVRGGLQLRPGAERPSTSPSRIGLRAPELANAATSSSDIVRDRGGDLGALAPADLDQHVATSSS